MRNHGSARIHQGERCAAHSGHGARTVRLQNVADHTERIGERLFIGHQSGERPLGKRAAHMGAISHGGDDPKALAEGFPQPAQKKEFFLRPVFRGVGSRHDGDALAFGVLRHVERNVEIEYHRNLERYQLLRWAQQAFDRFRVVPPGTGICHQVNLEYLSRVVFATDDGQAFCDTLVGTDSHTTMVNGLGVLGWGVGGIEAEAAMLGQPLSMLLPPVVGLRLSGELLTLLAPLPLEHDRQAMDDDVQEAPDEQP